MSAVPVPLPTPVAVNIVFTLLFGEPIAVKSVVPTVVILNFLPLIKLPAVKFLLVTAPVPSTLSSFSTSILKKFFSLGVCNCQVLI